MLSSIKEMYDEALVEDNIGEVQAVAYFNKRWEGSYTLIDKNGATLPSTATSVAIANCAEAAKVVVISKERTPEQKGSQKSKYEFKAWLNVTLS